MTGVAGGVVTGDNLEAMVETLWEEPWYEDQIVEAGDYGIAHRTHGEKDPLGHMAWQDDRRCGVVDGAVTNLEELGLDTTALFERLLADPQELLPAMEGPFAIAAVDASDDRIVLATDKLGSRPLYYTEPFAFASDLEPLLTFLDSSSINKQAISDLLFLGHMWGDRTLVSEISSLRPATVLVYEDGEITMSRYWQPSYDPEPAGEAYIFDLAKRFQQATDRVAQSMTGTAGLWLSGGLDSRMTANELARTLAEGARFDELYTYTYDSNPPGGVNPRLASRVSSELDLSNVRVETSHDRWVEVLEDAIRITDGMVQWHTLFNLSSVFNMESPEADIMMEGLEGSLVGHHLHPTHFQCDSPVASMRRSEASRDVETVEDILDAGVDPLDSFREEVEHSQAETMRGVVLDAHYQNYYARLALASNKIPRTQLGTRVPYVDGDFIEQSARMPLSYREKTMPVVDGDIPSGIPPAKIELMRTLSTSLSQIPYERTNLPPTYSVPAQIAGFVGTTAWRRLTGWKTHGGPGTNDELYRNHDGLQRLIDGLLDDACDRPYFDADAIRAYQQAHLDGEGNHISVLAPVTTIESWLQNVYEQQDSLTEPPQPVSQG